MSDILRFSYIMVYHSTNSIMGCAQPQPFTLTNSLHGLTIEALGWGSHPATKQWRNIYNYNFQKDRVGVTSSNKSERQIYLLKTGVKSPEFHKFKSAKKQGGGVIQQKFSGAYYTILWSKKTGWGSHPATNQNVKSLKNWLTKNEVGVSSSNKSERQIT